VTDALASGAAPERPGRRRRVGVRCLVALAIVLSGAIAGSAGAFGGTRRACAASGAHVPIVIDFGTVTSPPGPDRVQWLCVAVGPGATGSDVLAAASAQLHWPAPRYNSIGLLCAIGGYPSAPACADRSGSHFLYWSYWRGTASGWTYQSAGPATLRPSSCESKSGCAVEGWRFVDGADASATGLPKPRGPSNPAAICPPVATTTPATSPAPPGTGTTHTPTAPAIPGGASTPGGPTTTGRRSTTGGASTTTPAGHGSARHGGGHAATTSTTAPRHRAQVALGPVQAAAGRSATATAHPSGGGGHRNAAVGLGIGIMAVLAVLAVGFVQTRRTHP
jgi:hypothetical protein